MKKSIVRSAFPLLTVAVVLSGLLSCHSRNGDAYQDPLDLSGRDTSISPAQNFFEYANGTWLKNTKIPADKVGWGSFFIVEKRTLHQMKTILDSCASLEGAAKGSPAQQIGDLYTSALDSNAIEKAGLTPLKTSLDQIDSIRDLGDLLTVISADNVHGSGGPQPYYFRVAPDQKNTVVERLHFNQGGLGLPNKTYYFKTDSAGRAVMAAYHLFITKLLTLSGEDSVAARHHGDEIIALETKMAAASKTPVELRDPQANYHLMTVNELQKVVPQLHWATLLRAMEVKTDTLVVGQPKFYSALSGLLAATPISVWKEYLKFHLIDENTRWLSSPFYHAGFVFNQSLTGREIPSPRWERACHLVDDQLGDALGKIYVQRYFPPAAKAYMEKMVDNLKAAFKQHIENLQWMSDSTKAKALDKLAAMVKKIGYPDKWKDYSAIDISRSSLIGNLFKIWVWQYHYDIGKLGKPVDRSEWYMTPPTVNAYYNPRINDINFPAGILQPPFYFQHGDDAVNYGAIGLVIGHEMTHGFDDQGSQFDKHGNMHNWWSKEDREKFEKRARRIVDQYDHYVVLDTVHLNGRLTEGENIADNGGLSLAYTAFQETPEAHKDTLIDGLTPDQRFFMACAQVWRVKIRPQMRQTYISTDPHSPPMYRVNGPASNMTAFYKAFHVIPGDKMYRPDSIRVKIWREDQ